jgi:hypothetical protein
MIDIQLIQEKYASLPDLELLALLKEEASTLTPEAYQLLLAEISRRNLQHLLQEEQTGELTTGPETRLLPTRKKSGPAVFTETDLAYSFEQKALGKTDEEIVGGLLEAGLDEHHARILVTEIESNAKKRLRNAETAKLSGIFILAAGIALTFLPRQPGSSQILLIVAWSGILFGTFRSIKGFFYQRTYKNVIRKIGEMKSSNSSL